MLLHDISLLMTIFDIPSANTIFTWSSVSHICFPDQEHPFSKPSICKCGEYDSTEARDFSVCEEICFLLSTGDGNMKLSANGSYSNIYA